jgi:hypothetical protein
MGAAHLKKMGSTFLLSVDFYSMDLSIGCHKPHADLWHKATRFEHISTQLWGLRFQSQLDNGHNYVWFLDWKVQHQHIAAEVEVPLFPFGHLDTHLTAVMQETGIIHFAAQAFQVEELIRPGVNVDVDLISVLR